MAKPNSISISPDVVDAGLWELAVLDEQLSGLKGTQSERKAKATEAISVLPIGYAGIAAMRYDINVMADDTATVGDLRKYIAELTQWFSVHETGLVNTWLTNHKDVNATAIEVLQSKREVLVTQIVAFAAMFGMEVDIPKAPSAKGVSKPADSKGFCFWVNVHNKRSGKLSGKKYKATSQNNLSSVAFFSGPKLFGGSNVEDLRKAIKAVDPTVNPDILGKSWEVTFPNGSSMGLDVLDNSPESDDYEESEEDQEARELLENM